MSNSLAKVQNLYYNFSMLFRRKSKIGNPQYPPWNEIVDIMQNKGLKFIDYEVVKVLVSANKMHRCVITKSSEGYFSYVFEYLEKYDEEELRFLSPNKLPAYWVSRADGFRSIFGDIDSVLRELKTDPEYKTYFANLLEPKE